MKREIVPITQILAQRFYGAARPRENMRALVLLEDGEPAGIVGLAQIQGGMLLFSNFSRRPGETPISLTKMARRMLSLADEKKWVVYAKADLDISPAAGRYLEWLGFEPIIGGYKRVPK